ncbi:MAG: DNA-protecting protein DprA [Microbacterium sp.]|nr:MAG: DNA-protecting protein DprA [Microbacterium sp.]
MIDLSAAAVRRRTDFWLSHGEWGADDADVRDDLDARMIWSAISEPGDRVAGALVAACGARRALDVVHGTSLRASPARRGLPEGLSEKELSEGIARWTPRLAQAGEAAGAARRAGVLPLTPGHRRWPRRLDALGFHAPLCLWVRGDPRALSSAVSVALVGARAATAYGEHVAAELSAELASRGIAVVSGAAYGIDGAAHRAALAVGGTTTAWMAGGVDRAYPAGHRTLLERIVSSGGAVASDVPCGSAPTKWRFLARNRLIAASSDATVVVEAGWRSGSLNTAGHAAELGRPLGAVPGPVTSAASAGCHRLLREYDAHCVTGSDDVCELLGVATPPTLFDDAGHADSTRVADALSVRSDRQVAEIAQTAALSEEATRAALGLLALEGRAVGSGDGRWRASGR